MLRTQLSAALLLAATLVHADDGIDKFLGEYTAKTVCDSHTVASDVKPHIRVNGKFIIARFVNAEGEDRAIIVGKPGFSSYDWTDVEFEYRPGRKFDGIEIACPDTAGNDLHDNLAARRYMFNGRELAADEIKELADTLENSAGETGGFSGWEHLRAEYDFHGERQCAGGDLQCHVVKIYTYGDDQLFIEYQVRGGGIHAGHVHN